MTTLSSAKRRLKSTHVWKLKVLWTDGSKAWVPLSSLRESNPVEVAEYAKSLDIIDNPSFVWWPPCVLKKRDYIISKVNVRVKKVNHKYRLEVPKDYEDAARIDNTNKNTYWQDTTKKEMETILIAFLIQEKSSVKTKALWTLSGGHLVFDVKMDFTCKAHRVKNGYPHDSLIELTFTRVVSRETA